MKLRSLAQAMAGLLFIGTNSYAQTCNDQILLTTPSNRFELSADEAKDLQTGLIWKRCSVGQRWDGSLCIGSAERHDWSQALTSATGEWRLPNIKELRSIVERACTSPNVNLDVFPNTTKSLYWSSSPYTDYYSWRVNFDGGSGYVSYKSYRAYVRLVRSAE